jgi:hypothetical protein
MTRQVAFACNIARPKARDTPRSGHPVPTSLPCQPSRFHLPAPHQANPPSAQHSAREQERAGTARQACTGERFSAPTRKPPVQATLHAGRPTSAAQALSFSKFFLYAPNGSHFSCSVRRSDKVGLEWWTDSIVNSHRSRSWVRPGQMSDCRRYPTPASVRM